MTTFYLIRHGAIDWPDPASFIGQTDAPLSVEGRLQAGAWHSTLLDKTFAGVWTSDLARARETAAIMFTGRAVAIESSPALREIRLGEWEGLSRELLREQNPGLWSARGSDLPNFRPPGGESFQDLKERAMPCIERIAARTPGSVCCVMHAGVIRVLLCHALQVPLSQMFRFRLDYGSLSILSYSSKRIELCALNLRAPRPGGSRL